MSFHLPFGKKPAAASAKAGSKGEGHVGSASAGEPGPEFQSEKSVSLQVSQAKAPSAAVASADPLEALRSSLDEAVQEALKSFHAYVAVAVSRAASAPRGVSSSLPDQPFPRARLDPMASEAAQASLDVARKTQLDAALAAAFAEDERAGSVAPVKAAAPPIAPVLPPPPVAPVEPPQLPPPLPPAPVPTVIQAAPRSLPGVESPFTVVPPPELVAPGREPAAAPVFPFGKGVAAEIKEEKVPPVSASEPLPFSPFQGMAPVSSPPTLDKAAGAEPGLFRPPDGEKTPPWLPAPPAVLGFSKPPGPAFPPAVPAVAAPSEAAAEPGAARMEVPTFGIPQSATAPFRAVPPPPAAPPIAPPAAPPVPLPLPFPIPPPPVAPVGADAPAPAAQPAASVGFNFAELLRANGQRN